MYWQSLSTVLWLWISAERIDILNIRKVFDQLQPLPRCHCCERNFDYLNWLSARTCGAGQPHVWLCPILLVFTLICHKRLHFTHLKLKKNVDTLYDVTVPWLLAERLSRAVQRLKVQKVARPAASNTTSMNRLNSLYTLSCRSRQKIRQPQTLDLNSDPDKHVDTVPD